MLKKSPDADTTDIDSAETAAFNGQTRSFIKQSRLKLILQYFLSHQMRFNTSHLGKQNALKYLYFLC